MKVYSNVQKKKLPLKLLVTATFEAVDKKSGFILRFRHRVIRSTFALTMKEEFTLILAERTYLLKRIDHPEMTAAYQVQFTHGEQPLTFCMTRRNDRWVRLPQSLPYYVNIDGILISEAIEQNEAEG